MAEREAMSMYEVCLTQARADRKMRTVVARHLEGFKVTMMEWLLLGVVCAGPEKGHSMSSIARELDVTLPQVTALVNGLVKHRLVKQKTQSYDRRSRHVLATQRGRLLLLDMEAQIAKGLRDWLADIPDNELETYFHVVKRLSVK